MNLIEFYLVDYFAVKSKIDLKKGINSDILNCLVFKCFKKSVSYCFQSRTEDVLWELKRDQELVKIGWNIEWVFEGDTSKPLIEDLKKAGIKVKFKK